MQSGHVRKRLYLYQHAHVPRRQMRHGVVHKLRQFRTSVIVLLVKIAHDIAKHLDSDN
jgi:hypothetical protein